MDFSIRSYYSEKEEISDDAKAARSQEINNVFGAYFVGIDFSKFKEGIDPSNIYRILVWMIDGYLHEQQMKGKAVCPEEIEKEFFIWVKMFRDSTYKEEYL